MSLVTHGAEPASASAASLPAAAQPSSHKKHWQIEQIDFSRIDHSRIAHREDLFYLLTSASFIESGSDLYTSNLVSHYAGYPDVAAWLSEHWEQEELQHGRAFECYVKAAWPQFPWQQAFESFIAEYGPLCNVEELESDRALELAARCVVETGTTTYYQTLRGLSEEPVLTDLLGRIRADEVSHYKHFLSYFKQLREAQPMSRLRVAKVVYKRLLELRESDADVALRHVWAHKGSMFADGAKSFEEVSQRVFPLVSSRLPADQAVRMLLKPLMLPHRLEEWLQAPLASLARRVIGAA
ncbi:MAG: ferritin-like domain-containing protein [Pseudomonadota bacterium]|nr:ferritin-like domain-containing protein [Pseudomonadota bacterium]